MQRNAMHSRLNASLSFFSAKRRLAWGSVALRKRGGNGSTWIRGILNRQSPEISVYAFRFLNLATHRDGVKKITLGFRRMNLSLCGIRE